MTVFINGPAAVYRMTSKTRVVYFFSDTQPLGKQYKCSDLDAIDVQRFFYQNIKQINHTIDFFVQVDRYDKTIKEEEIRGTYNDDVTMTLYKIVLLKPELPVRLHIIQTITNPMTRAMEIIESSNYDSTTRSRLRKELNSVKEIEYEIKAVKDVGVREYTMTMINKINAKQLDMMDKIKELISIVPSIKSTDLRDSVHQIYYGFEQVKRWIRNVFILRRIMDKDYVTNVVIYLSPDNELISDFIKQFGFVITHSTSNEPKEIMYKINKNEPLFVKRSGCTDLSRFPKNLS